MSCDLQESVPRNMLDSSAPSMRRGKERETPKKKKPTPLRKVCVCSVCEVDKNSAMTICVLR